jgi:type IV pilus assembly protein PilC
MKFSYKAITKDGKSVSGVYEAANKEALIAALAKQGARPILVKTVGDKPQKSGGLGSLFGPKVRLRDLVIFTRQLSTLVSAGVPLPRSLATLQEQADNKYFKTVIAGIQKDVESGISLGDSFSKYPNVFSEVFVNMVRAGESGGILDSILKRLALQI